MQRSDLKNIQQEAKGREKNTNRKEFEFMNETWNIGEKWLKYTVQHTLINIQMHKLSINRQLPV